MPFFHLVRGGWRCLGKPSITFHKNVRSLTSKNLFYAEFGDPLHVVRMREVEVPPLKNQEVLVRMLAAPVNPADINTIQGKYPVKITLPSIPGNEGVGVVESVSDGVKNICPGDRVIVVKPLNGTWRDVAILNQQVLRVVPKELGVVEAATLTVNPCTAYRMLSDFKNVKDGLVVIQNGANSACGQMVIQICKAWGVKNINIVRNRPEINELKEYLKCLGATYVLTEEELRTTTIFKENKIDRPSLALNCVGGKNALEMVRHLQKSAAVVTYGAMSREPVTIPNASLIFKNISFHGFWMTAWNEKAPQDKKEEMICDIINLMLEKKLNCPVHKMVKFDDYKTAIGQTLSTKGFTGCRNPILPRLPSIPGDEGVGDVVEIGELVCAVEPGERVVLTSRMLGTWCKYGIYNERDVHVISPNIPLPEAAMLTIAPCTAYRMLKDFRKMKPGDTVIQNAANSPCGQSVIQLCKAWGINTLNIVASHCGYESVKENLLRIGATAVYTLEEAEELMVFNTSVTRPVLALNCLGGRFEDVLLRLLDKSGTIVYYGCAFDIPICKHILRSDVFFNRFHLGAWDAYASVLEKDVMMNRIVNLIVQGKFVAPFYQPLEIKNYIYALQNTVHCEAFATTNFVFDFTLT